MASFMGLFRRWLDPSDEDNNNQRQPNPSDGSNEDKIRSEMMLSFQQEAERQQKAFEIEIERLEEELTNAREETIALQRQHIDALATKETESQRLSTELRQQIDALNNRWMTEKRKSEEMEKTIDDEKTRQQQQLKMQRERNARQLKELQDAIVKQDRIINDERTETLRLRNDYQRALDAKESECYRLKQQESESQRLSTELRQQIEALNKRWLTERRKTEQLEKTTEDLKTRQQQQLQMQQESNTRKLKEFQDAIAKQDTIIKHQRTEYQRQRNNCQRAVDAREAKSQQLMEVNRRLADEVKVSVAEQKRREMAESILESQTVKVKHLDVQHKDAVKQLNVVNETLAKQRNEERTKFDSVEKHYKETLARKETDYGKLEQSLVDMNSTLEYQTKEMNIERRKNEILEKEIKENKERELKLMNKQQQQLNRLQGTVDQLTTELEKEKGMMTEVEKQRDQALATNEFDRQKFHKHLTDLNNRFKSRTKALKEEKQTRDALQMQLQEQKKMESQMDKALEMEKQAREALQIQLQEQRKIESEKDNALEMEKQAREALQMQLQKQKKIESQTDRALEVEKHAREVLQMQLQEQKKIECQKDTALAMEKKARGAIQMQLQEEKKLECQKDVQLQNCVKQLSAYRDEILFLTNEVETQNQKHVSFEKGHQELVRKANYDCESLRATVTELQNRLDNQAKTFLMEKQKGEQLEKQFRWQSEVLKHQECQLATTRKELNEVKELLSHREIELSNERLQNAYVDIDHQTLIAVKDQECKEFERQLIETREKFDSQTQLLTIERERREAISQDLEDQKKRQRETEEKFKKQLKELEERLKTLQTSGAKEEEEEEDVERGRETVSAAETEESPQYASQKSRREDAILENQKLSYELSVVREKLERGTEELDRERQTCLDTQEQNNQLKAERDILIENAAEEKEKLMSRITELDVEKRSRTNEPKATEMQLDEQMKRILDEQIKRISQLSEDLNEEKQKNLKLTIQRRHFRSQRNKILQQLQLVQEEGRSEQMTLQQQRQDTERQTTVDEDLRETSADSQEKVQSGNQAHWTLENNTRKSTIDAKAVTGEECTTSNQLNPLRLDENKMKELRERMKTLQRLGDKADAAVSHKETQDNESEQEKQQRRILTKIKEEPVETKYEETQTEVDTLPDEEDPPPPRKKRRRLEESISTGGVRVIEIKPEPNIKQEPIEEQIVRTPITTDSKDGSREPGPITKQEPNEERRPRTNQEPQTKTVVLSRKRLRAPSTSRSILKKYSECTATDPKANASTTKEVKSIEPEESVVHSSPEKARLVQTLRPQSLTTPVTGVAVLNGSLFVVSEMNSVVEVYDSTTFTFSGKVTVEDLTNPQSLTSCPLNSCLCILNRAQPSNAIFRLGLAPTWRHNKWLIGTDFGALASTSSGSLLLSCFDLTIKEFSSSGKLIRQFQFGQSTSDLRLFGAVQLHRTSKTGEISVEAQFAISYSHRRTGLRRVCTVDRNGQVVNPLLKYNGSCTGQHLILGQTGALFLADFGMGEVFQWNADLKNCRTIRRKKNAGFRPLRICLDNNDERIIIAEVSLSNDGTTSGTSKLSIYDL